MLNRNLIPPLLCLIATPLYASTVDPHLVTHGDTAYSTPNEIGQHVRRDHRQSLFTGSFEVEHTGTFQVLIKDLERNAQLTNFDIKFTAGKKHLLDYSRNEDGFSFTATPGKYGFSILAKGHHALQTGGLSVHVVPLDMTPVAVPLPAAGWLFSFGVVGLIAAARRKAS